MKKKIGLIISMIVLFVFIFSGVKDAHIVHAKENNDFVIGTHNLNNTEKNSAKVGNQLLQPEKGWKRYDDYNSSIRFVDKDGNAIKRKVVTFQESYDAWKNNIDLGTIQIININSDKEYSSTRSFFQSKSGEKIIFSISGTKLRILGFTDFNNYKPNVSIKIDGVEYSYSLALPYKIAPIGARGSRLVFEINNLRQGNHVVEITSKDKKYFSLDAIDIDENGELKLYEGKQEIEVESITLDKTSMDLIEGSSDKLNAKVLPENATNKKVVWSSSNEKIAKVGENGKVIAIKEGKATITAKVEETDLTATCKVNVTKKVEEYKNNAILSISLVNGATKEYDVSIQEVERFINWFEERSNGVGPSFYSFNKKINPYKSVKEYIVHDKIVSFEVREYEETNK